ncbi:segregation and condensation protein B [Lachnospiraceae bacterium KM106-2]|nr:segregation and condensation protein B [Lachnospiraceae bacterium KM106-2]
MEIQKVQASIEAILFTMGEAVELSKIATAIEHDEETTKKIIHGMMDDYKNENRGIQIIELDGAFQLSTKSEMYETIVRVAHIPKKHVLTDVLLETLSIIAYKQPITKQEIEAIRGVKSDHAVNKLVEYNLVSEVGRLDAPGKPILFATTEEFLRSFGVESLEDLPTLNTDTIEDFKHEAEEEVQLQLELDEKEQE